MSLKIVATLIMAGLVAQSSAFVLKGVQNDVQNGVQNGIQNGAYPLPGFTYTSKKNADHEKLSISSDGGFLRFMSFSNNVSAWSLIQGDGFSTISREVSYPVLFVSYYVDTIVGDVTCDDGLIGAYLGNSTFDVSLTASRNSNKCKLAPKITKATASIGLTHIDDAFEAPSVLKDLETVIWDSLADELTATLTDLLARRLPRRIDTRALCKQILAATPQNFPEPDF